MFIKIMTNINDHSKMFKTYDDAIEFLTIQREIEISKKLKGSVTISSKKEFDNWIKSL